MSVPRSPGQAAPRTARHSINFYFGTRLIVPVACLTVLWALVTAAVLLGFRAKWHWLVSAGQAHPALAGAAVIAGAGIVVMLVAIALMGRVARRLTREVDALATTARYLADNALPKTMAALRDGQQAADLTSTAPWPWGRPEPSVTQLADAADAIARMQRSAIGGRAPRRACATACGRSWRASASGTSPCCTGSCASSTRWSSKPSSPSALGELFALDHLTTRMRRHAESLTHPLGRRARQVLERPGAGDRRHPRRGGGDRGLPRVTTATDATETVIAAAVTDVIHLLAELIENATLFSPSTTRVEVRAERVANGFAIEVEDRGLGMEPDQLTAINEQLANPPDFDVADADRLGLFVTGRLAARHGDPGVPRPVAPTGASRRSCCCRKPSSSRRRTAAPRTWPTAVRSGPACARPRRCPSSGRRAPGRSRRSTRTASPARPARWTGTTRPRTRRTTTPSMTRAPSTACRAASGRAAAQSARAGDGGGAHAAAAQAGPASMHVPPEAPAPEHARNLVLQRSWQSEPAPTKPGDRRHGTRCHAARRHGTARRGDVMADGDATGGRDLAWLLDDLSSRVEDFRRAVILSRDGLLHRLVKGSRPGRTPSTCRRSRPPCRAWPPAPATASTPGGVRQTIIELEKGLLFVIAAGEGSCLAALCPPNADAGHGRVRDGDAGEARQAAPDVAAQVPGDPVPRRSD